MSTKEDSGFDSIQGGGGGKVAGSVDVARPAAVRAAMAKAAVVAVAAAAAAMATVAAWAMAMAAAMVKEAAWETAVAAAISLSCRSTAPQHPPRVQAKAVAPCGIVKASSSQPLHFNFVINISPLPQR